MANIEPWNAWHQIGVPKLVFAALGGDRSAMNFELHYRQPFYWKHPTVPQIITAQVDPKRDRV